MNTGLKDNLIKLADVLSSMNLTEEALEVFGALEEFNETEEI